MELSESGKQEVTEPQPQETDSAQELETAAAQLRQVAAEQEQRTAARQSRRPAAGGLDGDQERPPVRLWSQSADLQTRKQEQVSTGPPTEDQELVDLLVELDNKSESTKSMNEVHPLGTKNVCRKCHVSPSIHPLVQVQSMWTKVVERQTLASTEQHC